jgi:6-pyruvoyl-tetrahydropterin synthase-like protein
VHILWTTERARTAVLAAVVLVPTLLTAILLLPELTVPVASTNDDATHFLIIQRASEALANGENVLDHWVPQLELGFPWFVYYQPLPALVVVLLHRILFGALDLLTVFNLVRYALLVAFPLTVFWSLRYMRVPVAGAVVAAAVAPLLSGDFRYGFDYDSYVWRGFGMFTQLCAMHLSFVTLALFYRFFTEGRGARAAVIALSALVMTHLIYSYMMAITLLVLFLITVPRAHLVKRAAAGALVVVAAALATSMMWLPFIAGRAYLGVTPYLQPYKYDSFGAADVLRWLVTGDLLDHGRLPFITALVGLGLVVSVVQRTQMARTAAVLFAVWLVLYFGRPTLGALVDLLPFHEGLLMHRFIGGVDLFAIVLVGIGAAWVFERAGTDRSIRRCVLACVAALALLAPALAERASFYSLNTGWMRDTAAAIANDSDARQILDELAARPPGRVFAGLRDSDWGRALDFGIPFNSVRFSDLLVFNRFSVVASPYSSITLNADLLWDFDVTRPDHYDLFNVRYVVAPTAFPTPAFLVPLRKTARYVLYEAATSGYTEFAAATTRERVDTQVALFLKNRDWVRSSEPAARRFIHWDYPRVTASGADPTGACGNADLRYERALPSRIEALVACREAASLVFKVTYHPNWRVWVDDREVSTFMATPSYLAVSVPPGEHFVRAAYESTPVKTPLLGVGLVTLVLISVGPSIATRVRRRRAVARQRAIGE